ncbi:MAG: FAD-dependent monooxygenase, partial [Gordonia sp. (in: high G+C Gram-positive bacteria)]
MTRATSPRDDSTATVPDSADVLVVGAGPAGSSAAAHAAAAGHDVVLLDAATFPRDKTCGDGLTPRAVHALDELGMHDYLDERPRIAGLDLHGWGARQQVRWPDRFGAYGSAVARTEFDDAVRRFALGRGVRMVSGAKAVDAQLASGRIEAVTVQAGGATSNIRVREVIVADGVRSALGKALGREWHRYTAYGVAARSYV